MKTLFFLTAHLFFYYLVAAQPQLPPPPTDLANNLAIATQNFRQNNTIAPGVMVRIYNPNNWEWSYANGINDIASNSPATPNLRFRVASISKIICAVAILKLAQQGTIKLNDKISQWLPAVFVNQVETGTQIRIRDLLNHTSGLDEPQQGTSLAQDFLGNPSKNYRDTLFNIIAAQNTNFAGYGNFFYSNANFNVLAEIVKIASGVSYQAYIQQNIIQALGLNDTYMDILPIENSFRGYVPCTSIPNCTDEPFKLIDYSQANVGWGYGAADVSSTTKDLIKFYYALNNGQIIAQNWVDSLTTFPINASPSFSNKNYGYGTMIFTEGNIPFAIGHTGTAASHANVLCKLNGSNIYICFSFNIIRANREAFLDLLRSVLGGSIPTAIEDELQEENISVYPVPTQAMVNINIPNTQTYTLTLTNLAGQIVQKTTLSNGMGSINLANEATGVYILTITDNKNRKIQKRILKI